MVFQASQSSFNPVRKIKTQFLDTVWAHDRSQSKEAILERSAELLRVVMLDPDKVLNAYPHELSGGMKQRTLIALALLLQPKLVILDEPTTALDLLTQEKILRLLKELKKEYGFSLLFITHDLGIVSELADKVVTMYAGKAVEIAPVREFFQNAAHPYSKGLVNAIPRLTLDDREIVSIPGTPPDMVAEEHGCAFAPRCNRCTPECLEKVPMNTSVAGTTDRYCACWNPMLGGEHSGKDC
jgi:peptide/nickel transport system ATP-binding protein